MTDTNDDKGLSDEQAEEVAERVALSSPQIFEVVRQEGIEELRRPTPSLFWSGTAAGIALSFSVYCTAFLHSAIPMTAYSRLFESAGYTVGFIIVILGRLQLFTENTITVVLPILTDFNRSNVGRGARLWGIVWVANMIGAFLSAWVVETGGVLPQVQLQAALAVSRHLLEYSASESLLYGIPAGFLVASIVWLAPNGKASEFWIVFWITYMIALGGLTHVVAGATEWFLLVLAGELSWAKAILAGILPALLGNIIGGTGLFALITYGQVKREL